MPQRLHRTFVGCINNQKIIYIYPNSLTANKKNIYRGVLLAVLATMIWSVNFIVARGVIHEIPPVSLAFFRWLTGSVIITPFAFNYFRKDFGTVKKHWKYFVIVSILGITVYNTLIYVAGRYLPAVNLALIGTTSSPLMSIVFAAIFLREKVGPLKMIGLLICIAGILLLLSKGIWQNLINFHFSEGDWWILSAALSFAIYNILVRKKPTGISSLGFLFITFWIGTLLLAPVYFVEAANSAPIHWTGNLMAVIFYLGLGNSVLSFLFWNASIAELGAGRTALFGNLIPVFSSIEAVLILGEKITAIHVISGLLVIGGLVLANIRSTRPKPEV